LNSTTACKALTICMRALAHRFTNSFTWPREESLLDSLGETTCTPEALRKRWGVNPYFGAPNHLMNVSDRLTDRHSKLHF
jgi:hypothetical protein